MSPDPSASLPPPGAPPSYSWQRRGGTRPQDNTASDAVAFMTGAKVPEIMAEFA